MLKKNHQPSLNHLKTKAVSKLIQICPINIFLMLSIILDLIWTLVLNMNGLHILEPMQTSLKSSHLGKSYIIILFRK